MGDEEGCLHDSQLGDFPVVDPFIALTTWVI